ncbi:hypothetical protein BBJ28_00008076 [Nothophytophthora sp. Chile5]|nr:hypothetical protein BBJ28_00008076 [Nothophytophthora sp. Chile5]
MRWYCVHPSLPPQAELRIRAAPDSSAPERARISQGKAVAVCAPAFQVPSADPDAAPLSWFPVAFLDKASGETEGGFMMACLPDGTSLLAPWEDTDFHSCCNVENPNAFLFDGPLPTAQRIGTIEAVAFPYGISEVNGSRARVLHAEFESVWIETAELQTVCARLQHASCQVPHSFFMLNEMLPEEAQIAIRAFPSKEAETVGLLSRGEILEAATRGGNWLQIADTNGDDNEHGGAWIMWRTDALELLVDAPDHRSGHCQHESESEDDTFASGSTISTLPVNGQSETDVPPEENGDISTHDEPSAVADGADNSRLSDHATTNAEVADTIDIEMVSSEEPTDTGNETAPESNASVVGEPCGMSDNADAIEEEEALPMETQQRKPLWEDQPIGANNQQLWDDRPINVPQSHLDTTQQFEVTQEGSPEKEHEEAAELDASTERAGMDENEASTEEETCESAVGVADATMNGDEMEPVQAMPSWDDRPIRPAQTQSQLSWDEYPPDAQDTNAKATNDDVETGGEEHNSIAVEGSVFTASTMTAEISPLPPNDCTDPSLNEANEICVDTWNNGANVHQEDEGSGSANVWDETPVGGQASKESAGAMAWDETPVGPQRFQQDSTNHAWDDIPVGPRSRRKMDTAASAWGEDVVAPEPDANVANSVAEPEADSNKTPQEEVPAGTDLPTNSEDTSGSHAWDEILVGPRRRMKNDHRSAWEDTPAESNDCGLEPSCSPGDDPPVEAALRPRESSMDIQKDRHDEKDVDMEEDRVEAPPGVPVADVVEDEDDPMEIPTESGSDTLDEQGHDDTMEAFPADVSRIDQQDGDAPSSSALEIGAGDDAEPTGHGGSDDDADNMEMTTNDDEMPLDSTPEKLDKQVFHDDAMDSPLADVPLQNDQGGGDIPASSAMEYDVGDAELIDHGGSEDDKDVTTEPADDEFGDAIDDFPAEQSEQETDASLAMLEEEKRPAILPGSEWDDKDEANGNQPAGGLVRDGGGTSSGSRMADTTANSDGILYLKQFGIGKYCEYKQTLIAPSDGLSQAIYEATRDDSDFILQALVGGEPLSDEWFHSLSTRVLQPEGQPDPASFLDVLYNRDQTSRPLTPTKTTSAIDHMLPVVPSALSVALEANLDSVLHRNAVKPEAMSTFDLIMRDANPETILEAEFSDDDGGDFDLVSSFRYPAPKRRAAETNGGRAPSYFKRVPSAPTGMSAVEITSIVPKEEAAVEVEVEDAAALSPVGPPQANPLKRNASAITKTPPVNVAKAAAAVTPPRATTETQIQTNHERDRKARWFVVTPTFIRAAGAFVGFVKRRLR